MDIFAAASQRASVASPGLRSSRAAPDFHRSASSRPRLRFRCGSPCLSSCLPACPRPSPRSSSRIAPTPSPSGSPPGPSRAKAAAGLVLAAEAATTRFGGALSVTLPSGFDGANPDATSVAAAAQIYVGRGRTARVAGTVGLQLVSAMASGRRAVLVGPSGGVSYRAVQTEAVSVVPAVGVALLIPATPGDGYNSGAQYSAGGQRRGRGERIAEREPVRGSRRCIQRRARGGHGRPLLQHPGRARVRLLMRAAGGGLERPGPRMRKSEESERKPARTRAYGPV